MKICLINNLYKPFNRGGSERVVEIIAKELQKQKHQAFIISTKPLYFGQSQKNQTQTNYYLSSLFFYLEKIPLVLKFFWHIWNIFNFINYFKIKKILKKEKPDIVMTHNLMGVGFLIPKLIQKLKIKHYHTLHDIQLLYPTGLMLCGREKKINQIHSRIYAKICAWLFSSPTKIIAPSQWLLNLHDKKNFFKHAKKIILKNPIVENPNIFLKKKINNKKFTFLYVGQIENHKGIFFLHKSWEMLCDDTCEKKYKLIIIGSGSKITELKKISKKNKSIKLFGALPNKEVKKNMAKSDCLIVPSLCYENSPTVIYESALLGLPVIASRLGGSEELVHDLGGILFYPKNEGDLMYKMKWAMNNPKHLKKISQKQQKNIKKLKADNYIKKLLNKKSLK